MANKTITKMKLGKEIVILKKNLIFPNSYIESRFLCYDVSRGRRTCTDFFI